MASDNMNLPLDDGFGNHLGFHANERLAEHPCQSLAVSAADDLGLDGKSNAFGFDFDKVTENRKCRDEQTTKNHAKKNFFEHRNKIVNPF
jgi:hypothetical protein